MKYDAFVAHLPKTVRDRLSSEASIRWHRIHGHVFATGFTDRFDNALSKILEHPSDAVIARTLKQMSEAGLLKPNRVVVKYTEIGRAFLGIGFTGALNREGPPPGAFIRYTLPGFEPALRALDRKSRKRSRGK